MVEGDKAGRATREAPPEANDRNLAGLVESIKKGVRKSLSKERRKHSKGCALFAAEACARAGLDPLKGLAAGWAHDLAKELPVDVQRDLARACPIEPPAVVFSADTLLHGPAAAALLQRDYGVQDREILEAVALHTIGRADMGTLAKIVWAADKMEEGRRHVDAAVRRSCITLPPDELLLAALKATIDWHRSKGRTVAPETLDLYNTLLEKRE